MLWMFRLVLTKDPGRLRRADTDSKFTTIAELVEANQNPYKFCIHCEMIQPDKSRHCKLCNICVLEYDHHCLFLNNCVAKNNHRIFVIFIMELIVAHVIFIVSALYYIYLKYNRPFLTVWTTVISEEVWVLVLTVMNAFTLIWESWLLKEQFEAISMGTTTYFKQNSDRRYSRSLRCRTFFMFLIEDKRRHDFQLERSIDI
ncbi:AKR1 Palmitoyltransferase, partial [Amia calva]|nr:AKR1 Palmitoyltransferase [Amia calva]